MYYTRRLITDHPRPDGYHQRETIDCGIRLILQFIPHINLNHFCLDCSMRVRIFLAKSEICEDEIFPSLLEYYAHTF